MINYILCFVKDNLLPLAKLIFDRVFEKTKFPLLIVTFWICLSANEYRVNDIYLKYVQEKKETLILVS